MKPEMTTSQYVGRQFEDMSEESLQNNVLDIARMYGWYRAHFRTVKVQRQNGTTYHQTPVQADGKGFPDLVLVRDRVLFVELKAMNGILRPDQKVWRDKLKAGGAEWYLFRPKDFDEIHRVLK